jgi:hypothetical protein
MFLNNLPDKYNDALFRFRSVKRIKIGYADTNG